MDYQKVGRPKKEFKKLLKNRKQRLLFIKADFRYYKEIYEKELNLDSDKINKEISELESKLKLLENRKDKKSEEKKFKIRVDMEDKRNKVNKRMEVIKKLYELEQVEKMIKKYIKFLEKYIQKKRWKK